MSWSEFRIDSWRDFDEQVLTRQLSLTSLKHTYVFRGQFRDWPLLPSLARLCRDLGFDTLQAQDVEHMLLVRYKARVSVYLPNHSHGGDVVSLWTLMQHYRAPTRILDWTFSPVVALYFAVAEDWDDDGVLWSFHRRRVMNRAFPSGIKPIADEFGFSDQEYYTKVNSNPKFCAFDRGQLTQRMISQDATFTMSQDVMADHSHALELLCPEIAEEDGGVLRRKWIISKSSKPTILRRLHAMNVSAETLFPGIDGLGGELREFVRLASTRESVS